MKLSKRGRKILREKTIIFLAMKRRQTIQETTTARLRDLFMTSLTDVQHEVTLEAVKALKRTTGLTEVHLRGIIQTIEEALGKTVNEKLQENVSEYVEFIYGRGKQKGRQSRAQFSFDPWDEKAIEWNTHQAVYWIGDYYTRQLARDLQDLLIPAFTEGASRAELTGLLESYMVGFADRSSVYFEGLANHIVTRSFNFGQVAGLDEAGFESYRISAVMDDRTTPICRTMNGTKFSISKGKALATYLMTANDPDEVKTLAPWLQPEDLGEFSPEDGDSLPGGMALPPYHFFCRTTIVPD